MGRCLYVFGKCIPIVAVFLLSILILSSIYLVYFGVAFPSMSVLSADKIYIDPKGYEDTTTHEWRGSFWVILATTKTKDNQLFYQFDKADTEAYNADNTIDSKTLYPKATITITVTALQPYWQIALKRTPYMVFPKTYGMGMNRLLRQPYKTSDYVDPLYANVYEFSGAWEHHAPFQIVVEKSGDYSWKSETITVDLVGSIATVPKTITSPKGESLILELEGLLETGYGQPTWSDLVIFDRDNVFLGSDVRNLIRYDTDDYSYSNYWFGGGRIYTDEGGTVYPISKGTVQRWGDDKSPAHYFTTAYGENLPVSDVKFSGSDLADTTTDFVRKPLAPKDVYSDVPTAKPYGKSLIRYLTEDRGKSVVNLNLWNEGYELDTTNKVLKIKQPMRSVSWLYTLKISTELADTFVYQPLVGNGKIVECRWVGSGQIGDTDMAIVKVKQLSSEESMLTVDASIPSGLPVKITPSSDSAIIKPNDVKTFNFEVKNLGADKQESSKITFKVLNDLGSITDTATLDFTLLPVGVGETILTVYTVDAETPDLKISGIQVTISWDTLSKSQVTSEGRVTFSLGGYQGGVSIATLETTDYQSASKSVSVTTGQNTVFLHLQKRETTTPWWMEYLWYIIAGVVVVVAIVMAVYGIRTWARVRGGK